MSRKVEEARIECLPLDILAHVFLLVSSFTDLAQASSVCKKWRQGVKQSLARRNSLSFAGYKMDDDSTARIVSYAYNIKHLDISRSCWGCQITDEGLFKISSAKCITNLTSISLWGMTGITDKGVLHLVINKYTNLLCCIRDILQLCFFMVSRAHSLQHLNIGGTFVTDESLFAIANSCSQLKAIVLWSCRHVTEGGLIAIVNRCHKLESINVWGTGIPVDCFIALLALSPGLQIKPQGLKLEVGRVSVGPVV